MLRLSLLDARSGHRVLPALYSDNCLWLLPGESRTITTSWPADVVAARPKVRGEGYHVPGTTSR
ncbi:glycoside hydrolase family 2 protein [Streptomyces sp. NPDC101151]|uniref:glycoside hydrolase family 2 protein n=1 Tax=Streptomyces sp. NPDC101151 TaxID=3366115 RepID=UPI00382CEA81